MAAARNPQVLRALYRQMVRWCRSIPSDIPLAQLCPPVNLQDIDPVQWKPFRERPNVRVEGSQCTIAVQSAEELAEVIRLSFRHSQQPASTAFESLRALNELRSGVIDGLQKRREEHREPVKYQIGQVVQHAHERWRGVVTGWERPTPVDAPPTSLTNKDYTNPVEHVRYTVTLDSADAHMMGSSSGVTTAVQADLELLEDPQLQRLRIPNDKFTRFDGDHFEPNDLLAYEYPADTVRRSELDDSTVELCERVSQAVRDLADRLARCVLDETSTPESRGYQILANVLERLEALRDGDVLPSSMQLASARPTTIAAHHVRDLLQLQLEVYDVNYQRKVAKEHSVQFTVGDVVQHKLYDFRGVVVAWDPFPQVDVSRWDGLQHIANPMLKPFYHIIPDQQDCIDAFGGERPFRYVCEDNLDLCQADRRSIEVELDYTEWKRNENGMFDAPSDVKYKYGVDLDDGGTSERCMMRLQEELNSWHILGRANAGTDSITSALNQETLSRLLLVLDTVHDAMGVQETLKEMRKAHLRLDLRWRFETANTALISGRAESAIESLQALIREDPGYVEAWNRLATCQFMLGKSESSMQSTLKVLDLDPTHVQAMNGLGLLYFEKQDYSKAIEAFRDSLRMDPWSPVASKLSMALDLHSRIVLLDELSK